MGCDGMTTGKRRTMQKETEWEHIENGSQLMSWTKCGLMKDPEAKYTWKVFTPAKSKWQLPSHLTWATDIEGSEAFGRLSCYNVLEARLPRKKTKRWTHTWKNVCHIWAAPAWSHPGSILIPFIGFALKFQLWIHCAPPGCIGISMWALSLPTMDSWPSAPSQF